MDSVVVRLKATLEVVRKAEIPNELQAIAFECAFKALEGNSQNRKSNPIELQGLTTENQNTGNLQTKARQLGIDTDALLELFTEADGALTLTIPTSRLPTQKKGRVETLALVATFLRQGAGWEEFTSHDVIGAEAEEYGCRDSNFSTYLKGMGESFQMKTENGKRYYKLKRAGWEQAAKEINRLAH